MTITVICRSPEDFLKISKNRNTLNVLIFLGDFEVPWDLIPLPKLQKVFESKGIKYNLDHDWDLYGHKEPWKAIYEFSDFMIKSENRPQKINSYREISFTSYYPLEKSFFFTKDNRKLMMTVLLTSNKSRISLPFEMWYIIFKMIALT